MKRLNRILTVVVGAVLVTAGWAATAHTPWAAARTYLGAGLDLDSWWSPLVVFGALVMVAVSLTRLVERTWKALFPEPVRPARVAPRRSAPAA